MKTKYFNALLFYGNQGCGARTHISGSGSRHVIFLAPATVVRDCLGFGSIALTELWFALPFFMR